MPYQLTDEVRAQAESRVIKALESDVREERHLAAQAQLSHRLRNGFQRIDDRRQIDMGYVTCAEYQLFLDEMSVHSKWFQPDHWGEQRFASGQSRTPVTGVRPEDAEVFCRWLTQKQGGNARYRLPTRNEILEYPYPILRGQLAAWCRDNGHFFLDGMSPSDIEELLRRSESRLGELLPSLSLMDVNRNRDVPMFEQSRLGNLSVRQVVLFILGILLSLVIFKLVPWLIMPLLILMALGVAVLVTRESDQLILMFLLLLVVGSCMAIPFLLGLIVALILINPLKTLIVVALSLVLVTLYVSNDHFHRALHAAGRRFFSIYSAIRIFVRPKAKSVMKADSIYDVVDLRKPDGLRLEKRQLTLTQLSQRKSIGLFERWCRKIWSITKGGKQDEQALAVLDVHWWLRLVIARECGEFPSWEGIRLVREE